MRGTQIMKIPSGGYPTDPGRENNLQDSLSCLMSGREETTGSTPDADIYFWPPIYWTVGDFFLIISKIKLFCCSVTKCTKDRWSALWLESF